MRYIKTRPKSQSAFKVALRRSPLPFCSSFETKKKLVLLVKKRALGGQSASSKVFYVRTGKGSVCVYMCRVEIILIVFIFLWSLFIILFFLFGEKKDSMWESIYLFISWDKKTSSSSSSSSKKWRLSKREKLDSLFFTRFIKPLPPVLLVFKKDDDDDFDDDNNALSSSV